MALHPILPLGIEIAGSPRGAIGRLEVIAIERLVIDDTYQRSVSARSVTNIRRIAAAFDWAKFLPVIVTEVSGDGGERFAIVDGQHRATAAATLGITAVPCYVLACTASEAAAAFAAINGNVTPVAPIDLWFAELAAGDPKCRELQRVLEAAGVTVTRKKEGHRVGETRSINVLRRALHFYGAPLLTTILQCITETGTGNPGMIVGASVNGIGMAIRTKPDLLARPSDLFAVFDGIDLAAVTYAAKIEQARTGNVVQWIITRTVNEAIRAARGGKEGPDDV